MTNGFVPEETLTSILDHLNTLSKLVMATSRASAAELENLGERVESAVDDLEALRERVARSLASFDVVRQRVQEELADRPPLTDDDIDRIAEGVTERLLDEVRVEPEQDEG